MKTLKNTLSAIILTSLVAFSSFATGNEVTPENKSKAVLTVEEAALETELNEEFDITIEEAVASLNESIEKVVVYNLAGEVVYEAATENGTVDSRQIPVKSDLLMTDNGVQYYLQNK